MLISIIIPIYNEEKRLKNGLESISGYISLNGDDQYQLVAVDDGSQDLSLKILSDFQKSHQLTLVRHEYNLGKGAALRSGVEVAKGDLILFTDIDFSVPIETLKKFINQAKKGFEIVIGSRRVAGARILTHQSQLREAMGRIFTQLSNAILGTNFSDVTCGFKLFSRQAAQDIFSQQKINGWAFDSEILFMAQKKGYRVSEIGVDWSDVKGSQVRFPQDIFKSFMGLLKIRWYNLWGKYHGQKAS